MDIFYHSLYPGKKYNIPLPRACVQLTSQMERFAALFEYSCLPALSEIKGGGGGLEAAGNGKDVKKRIIHCWMSTHFPSSCSFDGR